MEPSLQFITSVSLHEFLRKRPCSSLCLLRVQKLPSQNTKTGHLPKAILSSTASEQPWHKLLYLPPLRKQPPKSKMEIKPFGLVQINREGFLREPSHHEFQIVLVQRAQVTAPVAEQRSPAGHTEPQPPCPHTAPPTQPCPLPRTQPGNHRTSQQN